MEPSADGTTPEKSHTSRRRRLRLPVPVACARHQSSAGSTSAPQVVPLLVLLWQRSDSQTARRVHYWFDSGRQYSRRRKNLMCVTKRASAS